MPQYRIAQNGDEYYLLMKNMGKWVYACGYNQGAPGPYNYGYCIASNPFYHIEYTIPEIEKERKNPSLSLFNIIRAKILRPKKPCPESTIILDISDFDSVRNMINEHRINHSIVDPYPKLAVLKKVKKWTRFEILKKV